MVFLLLIIVQCGFGIYPNILKRFAPHLNQLLYSLFRDLFAFPIIALVAFAVTGKFAPPCTRRDFSLFTLLGFLLFLNQYGYIIGVHSVSPSVAAMFQPSIPVWTTAGALLVGIEPRRSLLTAPGLLKVAGILMAASGAFVTGYSVLHANPDHSAPAAPPLYLAPYAADEPASLPCLGGDAGTVLGVVALVVNTAAMAAYVLVQKWYIFAHPLLAGGYGPDDLPLTRWAELPVHATAWAYGAAAVWMGLTYALEALLRSDVAYLECSVGATITAPTLEEWGAIAYGACVASALCYSLITVANRLAPAPVLTAFWPLQVPVAIFVAWLFFRGTPEYRPPSIGEYIGGGLVVLGLLLVTAAAAVEARRAAAMQAMYSLASPSVPVAEVGDDVGADGPLLQVPRELG